MSAQVRQEQLLVKEASQLPREPFAETKPSLI